jgi:hypothetical protein
LETNIDEKTFITEDHLHIDDYALLFSAVDFYRICCSAASPTSGKRAARPKMHETVPYNQQTSTNLDDTPSQPQSYLTTQSSALAGWLAKKGAMTHQKIVL